MRSSDLVTSTVLQLDVDVADTARHRVIHVRFESTRRVDLARSGTLILRRDQKFERIGNRNRDAGVDGRICWVRALERVSHRLRQRRRGQAARGRDRLGEAGCAATAFDMGCRPLKLGSVAGEQIGVGRRQRQGGRIPAGDRSTAVGAATATAAREGKAR